MPLPPDAVRGLIRKLRAEGENAPSLDAFLGEIAPTLGPDAPLIEAIRERARLERATDILKAQEAWFQTLGWFLARLFMWGSLGAGLVCLLLWGRPAADPFTFGMAGAAVYYLLIQVVTPRRLARERATLEAVRAERRQEMLARLEELEREYDRPR